MMDNEYLPLSGIQHFCFCRRQWALIHLEQQWQENLHTAEGRLEHTRCHDDSLKEKRGDLLIVRGMRVISHSLRLSGVCDVVEFYSDNDGISLQGQAGKWRPFPVEYKHGTTKQIDADRLQLCTQAIALEEMLVCSISQGALYYATNRRREVVDFSSDLREATRRTAAEMNDYFNREYTPKVRPGKHCNACSLKAICLPTLCRKVDAQKYISTHIREVLVEENLCENC